MGEVFREYLKAGSKGKEVVINMGQFTQAINLIKNRRIT